MKIPVVLNVVHVAIDADGVLEVDVDGTTHELGQRTTRGDLRAVIDEVTADLGVPVRVEVREADGTTYSDIETPAESVAPAAAEPEPEIATSALAGAAFRPGEPVALAYVVARQQADAHGNAVVNLPPALLAATSHGLVFLGLTSLTVAPIEAQR